MTSVGTGVSAPDARSAPFGDLGQRSLSAPGEQHLPTLPGQRERGGGTDPAATAGDDRDPAAACSLRRILHPVSVP